MTISSTVTFSRLGPVPSGWATWSPTPLSESPTPFVAYTGGPATATLTFDDCSSATLAYQFDDNVLAGAYRDLGGTLHLAPLTACRSR